MTSSSFDPLTPIAIEDRYSLSHLFNVQNVSFDPSAKGLDAIFSDVIDMKASDLHIWFRNGDPQRQGHYRFCSAGKFVEYTDISVNHCQSITYELYRLIGNQEGISATEARVSDWGKSVDHQLLDGRKVRLMIGVCLTYPRGFDLLCRVLVK